MRWTLAIVIAAFVGACVVSGRAVLRGATSDAARPPAPPDKVLPRHIFASGVVEGADRELSLKFETPGRVKSVLVRDGDQVRKGDVLAELETDLVELQLADARTQLQLVIAERNQRLR